MSTFNVAVGIKQDSLNKVVGNLYNDPTAKKKLFEGAVTKDIDPIGKVTLSYEIKGAPEVILAPPSQQKWDASQRTPKDLPMPSKNVWQLHMTVKGSIKTKGADPVRAEGPIEVYGVLELSDNKLSLPPKAVWIDESKFSAWDKLIVNDILVPEALKIASDALSLIPLPKIPTFEGITLQSPIAEIVNNNEVVAATTLKGGPAPNLSGYTSPSLGIYALTDMKTVNTGLSTFVSNYENPFSKEDKKGTDAWYTSGRITANLESLKAAISGDGIQVAVGLQDVTGYGELGGVGVGVTKAVLCPVGSAVDAISNPKDWDKVVAQFGITYNPDPLDVPVSFKVATVKSEQKVQVSLGDVHKVNLVFKPEWSGSVSGTVLAAAAAAFADLILAIFSTKILNAVFEDHGQNVSVYTIPDVSTEVEGIKVSLKVPDGTALGVFGPYASQSFDLAFG